MEKETVRSEDDDKGEDGVIVMVLNLQGESDDDDDGD